MSPWPEDWLTPPKASCCEALRECRQALDACHWQHDEVRNLRAACEALQNDLAACQQAKERLHWRLGYLEKEAERLQALVAEQQAIIARQQAKLADLMPDA